MSGSESATRRYEVKFTADRDELPRIQAAIQMHGAGLFEPFPPRRVNNFYLDTHELYNYEQNLVGVSEKLKVRYRWYGDSRYPGKGQLEIKKKRGELNHKEIFEAKDPPYATGDTWRKVIERVRVQLSPRGRLWLDSCPQVVMVNRYDRRYYLTADRLVRVTLDVGQEAYEQRISAAPNVSAKLTFPDFIVVEVKADEKDWRAVRDVVQGIPLRASRFSKYATAVQSFVS